MVDYNSVICKMTLWIYSIASIVSILWFIRIYFRFNKRRNGSYTCLFGKTAVVTGSNCGIGLATALDFAKRGARLVVVCLYKNEGEEAKETIIKTTGNSNVVVEVLDLASLKSVRECAQRIKYKEDKIDILVNNAGAIIINDEITEDGLRLSMQINYLGPFLFTTLLIDLLKKSKQGRIINVSSAMAHLGEVNPNNFSHITTTSLLTKALLLDYANSKLCVMLWTNELAERLKSTEITANSLHPGSVYTNILTNRDVVTRVCRKISQYFLNPPEVGAQTTVHVAVSKHLENVSGEYFDNCRIATKPKLACDSAVARQLWEVSEDLVKLSKEERILSNVFIH